MIKGEKDTKVVNGINEAFQVLRDWDISISSTGYCVCPVCDSERKKKGEKKLHISVAESAIIYRCNHCDSNGAIIFSGEKYVKPKKTYIKPKLKNRKYETNDILYKRFLNRGISKEILDKFKIKLVSGNMFFPFYKNSEVVNGKTKSFDKKFMMMEKDCEKVLFGMQVADEIRGNMDSVVITEGEEEAMSYAECGIPAVSVPNGASKGNNNLDYINNCYDWLKTFNKYIIATDNDEAGKSLRDDLIKRIGKDKCEIIDYSLFDVKDGNDLLKKGKKFLIKAFDNKENVCPDNIIKYKDVFNELDRMYRGEVGKQYLTGWRALDTKLCIKTSNLMVVSGFSGRGKSFFVNNLLLKLTEKNNWKHLFFHFENSVEKHLVELLEMRVRKSFFEGKWVRISEEEKDKERIYLNRHFVFCNNSVRWGVKDICDKIREVVMKEGIKSVVIDPYNRIKKEIKQTELLLIEEMLASLSSLARELDILIVFIAHPAKPQGKEENFPPSLYHTAGSQAWYSICDYGIVIHRDRGEDKKYSHETLVTIQKVKTKDLGFVSEHYLQFDKYRLIDKGQPYEENY